MPEAPDRGYPASGALAGLAAALGRLLTGSSCGQNPEMLDVLAVAAGVKPVAVVGFAGGNPPPPADAFAPLGLVARHCTAWVSEGEFDGVPAWFSEAARKWRSTARLLAVSREAAALAPLEGTDVPTLDPAAEAALLGYPLCCTTAHAAWRAGLHSLLAEATLTAAGQDLIRAHRMVAANWAPTLRPDATDAPDLFDRSCAPLTGIVMCPDCNADDDGPARRISESYAALAADAGLTHHGTNT